MGNPRYSGLRKEVTFGPLLRRFMTLLSLLGLLLDHSWTTQARSWPPGPALPRPTVKRVSSNVDQQQEWCTRGGVPGPGSVPVYLLPTPGTTLPWVLLPPCLHLVHVRALHSGGDVSRNNTLGSDSLRKPGQGSLGGKSGPGL